MPNGGNRTSEHEMAEAVLEITSRTRTGCATLGQIRNRIERYIDLTDEDWEESDSQAPSPKWHQILRNIYSNRGSEGNFIYEGYLSHLDSGGYCITHKGWQYLRRHW